MPEDGVPSQCRCPERGSLLGTGVLARVPRSRGRGLVSRARPGASSRWWGWFPVGSRSGAADPGGLGGPVGSRVGSRLVPGAAFAASSRVFAKRPRSVPGPGATAASGGAGGGGGFKRCPGPARPVPGRDRAGGTERPPERPGVGGPAVAIYSPGLTPGAPDTGTPKSAGLGCSPNLGPPDSGTSRNPESQHTPEPPTSALPGQGSPKLRYSRNPQTLAVPKTHRHQHPTISDIPKTSVTSNTGPPKHRHSPTQAPQNAGTHQLPNTGTPTPQNSPNSLKSSVINS